MADKRADELTSFSGTTTELLAMLVYLADPLGVAEGEKITVANFNVNCWLFKMAKTVKGTVTVGGVNKVINLVNTHSDYNPYFYAYDASGNPVPVKEISRTTTSITIVSVVAATVDLTVIDA